MQRKVRLRDIRLQVRQVLLKYRREVDMRKDLMERLLVERLLHMVDSRLLMIQNLFSL